MSERIAISELRPGMVIEHITRQNGPVKIRKSGLVSSSAMVQGLAEMGVQEVEIDPEQTVEIAVNVRPKTQTQALLRGHHDTSASFDRSLSDQFNRSLFLPTVQGLPSVWKVYARQYLVVAILIAGGVGIGYTAATPQNWWPGLVSVFEPHRPAPLAAATAPKQHTPVAETVTARHKPAIPQDDLASQQDEVAQVKAEEQLARMAREPVSSQPVYAEPQQVQRESSVSEGQIINRQPEEGAVKVSPELMARFNEAVAELEKAEQDPDPIRNTRVNVYEDVPRVDQLPVNTLTRLPSMSFSAHMYASRSADRWVRVNGNQLGEGDWITKEVQIVNIEAQRVILSFHGEIFSMAALTDW
ncbi:DUF3391 domain-containing protein [Alteromonas aestuariivivens]|uniref:DUF3391 domain-containing protein n=1 Tax=Alteromonas aestuariivivens TaxID=1938339 RepID=A0A3D8M471_9ALTE|nr:general secretion pathway protein GspB [Alteromonas aestuariivivens]RDV24345.1 DUF3391 domain-containing protein [Alteromonas aestuariivivens]